MKAYVGYERLLEDPDVQAVYIPLQNHLHKEWCQSGIYRGNDLPAGSR